MTRRSDGNCAGCGVLGVLVLSVALALLASACGGAAPEQTGATTSGAEEPASADEDYDGAGGAGADATSAGGADSAGGEGGGARPVPPPPPPPLGMTLTQAERQTVLSYDGSMLQLQRDLTNAIPESGGADCGTACQASAAICDLATRICGIANRHPSDPELRERCEGSRRRCEEGQARVSRAGCGCQ